MAALLQRPVLVASSFLTPTHPPPTPSPWLHYYDDLFLVNAQGVFGFVNSHRVVLTLQYSHNETLPTPPPPPGCIDAAGTVGSDDRGHAYTCAELALAGACGAHPRLLAACPVACDVARCDGRLLPPPGELPAGGAAAGEAAVGWEEAGWEPLDFANLPGEPHTLPRWSSPYHHRLSWQVWIQTTAAMEPLASLEGPAELMLPPFVRELIRRVLRGDADVVHLLSPTARRALRRRADGAPVDGGRDGSATGDWGFDGPRAIRAQLWEYHFSSPTALLRRGEWWRREPLSAPVVYALPKQEPHRTRDTAGGGRAGGPRVAPWVRHRLLLLATLGVTAAADSLVRNHRPLAMLASLLFHLTVLFLIGTADYAAFPALAAALPPLPSLVTWLPTRLRPTGTRWLARAAAALARSQPQDAVLATGRLAASALALAAAAAVWAGGWRALCVRWRPVRECVAWALVPAGICWTAAMA